MNHITDYIELGAGYAAVWDKSTGIGTVTNNNTDSFHDFGRSNVDAINDGFGNPVAAPTLASATDNVVDEIERTYATGMTWTITRYGGGAFTNVVHSGFHLMESKIHLFLSHLP